jgi:hypothetical protein
LRGGVAHRVDIDKRLVLCLPRLLGLFVQTSHFGGEPLLGFSAYPRDF